MKSVQSPQETGIWPNSRARIWPNLAHTNVRFAVVKTTFFSTRCFYEHGSRSAGMIMYNLHVCIKGSKLAMDKWMEVSQWKIQCRAKSWFFCFQICLPYRWLVERAKTKWQRLRGSVSHPWSSPWLETNPCETCDPSLRQNYCKVRPKSSSMVSTRST